MQQQRGLGGKACGRAAAWHGAAPQPMRRWSAAPQPLAQPAARTQEQRPRDLTVRLFPFDQAWNPNVAAQVNGAAVSATAVGRGRADHPAIADADADARFWLRPLPMLQLPGNEQYQLSSCGCVSCCLSAAYSVVDGPLLSAGLAQSVAPQLFAVSLFPYLGFLYHLTKSGKAPKLTLFGFYFLLAFVGATIPAGIYGEAPACPAVCG